jgi:two-component system, NarL family, response regulator LiaR
MTQSPTIRVMTVDDHNIVRGGLRFVLLAFDDIELVGEAQSGQEAVRMCAELRPNVVLMDMRMAGMDGVATTRAIKQSCPQVQIVILSGYYSADLVVQAMQAGAVGYLLKDASMHVLAGAIRAARDGQTTLAAEVSQALVEASARATPMAKRELTERQRDILVLLVAGLSNTEIAERLALSPYTIRNYISDILIKLGVSSRAEAVALAVQAGILIGREKGAEDLPDLNSGGSSAE